MQVFVGLSSSKYSFLSNSISDLGNTGCGWFGGRFVCSAHPQLMNASFIALGICVIIGSLLFMFFYGLNKIKTRIGFGLMAVAGAGIIVVGLFPENLAHTVHFIGADLTFLAGVLAILIIGLGLKLTKRLRYYSLATAFVVFIGLILLVVHGSSWSGAGAAERTAASCEILWLIIFGGYIFFSLLKRTRLWPTD